MNDSRPTPTIATRTLRRLARAWSIASLGFLLVILIGELMLPHAEAPSGLLFFPFGTSLGMVLAWRWEGLGGAISVGSVLAFYVTLGLIDGRLPRGPFLALLGAPGALFLLSWSMTRASRERE